jgi:hypothetical protein
MPEFVLNLWAAMVLNSAKPMTTLLDNVPFEHRDEVAGRAAGMVRRIQRQNARRLLA